MRISIIELIENIGNEIAERMENKRINKKLLIFK